MILRLIVEIVSLVIFSYEIVRFIKKEIDKRK